MNSPGIRVLDGNTGGDTSICRSTPRADARLVANAPAAGCERQGEALAGCLCPPAEVRALSVDALHPLGAELRENGKWRRWCRGWDWRRYTRHDVGDRCMLRSGMASEPHQEAGTEQDECEHRCQWRSREATHRRAWFQG